MTWTVHIAKPAQKEMANLSAGIIFRIDAAILKLEKDPYVTGARKLRGTRGYRFRVGRYRILYDIDQEARTVTIFGIRHRKDAYR
ncbi:MAG: type II toxin-antitoxin system RelE/ParE family toxin [Planctomycetota bacterium]|nr:type II toxin-antitoxin system RelE/ParE family toxin [Planctomycetota bacterium]